MARETKNRPERPFYKGYFSFHRVIAENGDRDGIPNVIPEALASGCLVLASDKAGASEAFVDGISGFSINPQMHRE